MPEERLFFRLTLENQSQPALETERGSRELRGQSAASEGGVPRQGEPGFPQGQGLLLENGLFLYSGAGKVF